MNTYDEGKDGEETSIHTTKKIGSENKNKVFTEEEKANYLNNLRNKYKNQQSIEQQFAEAKHVPEKDKEHFTPFSYSVSGSLAMAVDNSGTGRTYTQYVMKDIPNNRVEVVITKEAARDLIKGYGKDIGIDFEVLYLDEATMPKDSKGSTGSSYILDKKNRKVLIPIDVNKLKDTGDLFGTLTEEVSHGKDALEGRQDLNVANDETNKEKGLESLGRPANEYVKNKLGEDNNSKISLTTDGIDLTNANVGEKVGDDLDSFEEEQYYNINGYKKDDGSFEVVVTPKKGESEVEAITNGHYKIKKTDDFLYAQEGNNPQIIEELSRLAKIKSIIDPYNNYIVTVSREEGINILAAPKAKSLKENQSKDFHEAVGNLAKSNKKVAENWKNGKYLSAAGNGIISVLSVPNLIQTGAASTTADLAYSFNSGEVQYGKKKDILGRRGANKAKAKGTTDSLISIVAASAMPNKIGGGTITVSSTAQAVVATGEVVGTAEKVITLPTLGTGGAQAMLMVSGVGSGSKDSDKANNNTSNEKQEKLATKDKDNDGSNVNIKTKEEEIKPYYETKKGKTKAKKYLEKGETLEQHYEKYAIENVESKGINVGRSKEHSNTTIGHWEKSIDIAEEASKDPNVKAVYVDETLKNISPEIFKNDKTRPDIVIEYKDETFKLIEVQSKTDRFNDLQDKLQNLQTKYGKDVIKNYNVEKPKGGK